ncbi:MAG: hypothetical protein NVSMB51_21880 [Solirubrobacteraceae bacterium]
MIALALTAAVLCGPARDQTLAAGAAVRVYAAPGGRVMACTRGRRPLTLGANHFGRSSLGPFAVHGVRLAFALRTQGVDTGGSTVRELDLRSGRPLLDVAAVGPVRRPESFDRVTALVLGAGGVAWIASTSGIGQRPSVEVHTVGALLAAGPQIDPRRLGLRGARVHWRQSGADRSAALRGPV